MVVQSSCMYGEHRRSRWSRPGKLLDRPMIIYLCICSTWRSSCTADHRNMRLIQPKGPNDAKNDNPQSTCRQSQPRPASPRPLPSFDSATRVTHRIVDVIGSEPRHEGAENPVSRAIHYCEPNPWSRVAGVVAHLTKRKKWMTRHI